MQPDWRLKYILIIFLDSSEFEYTCGIMQAYCKLQFLFARQEDTIVTCQVYIYKAHGSNLWWREGI
jgi:hypothetical protein